VRTPKEQWTETEALIFSVDWIEPSRGQNGHYEVVYSYRVGEERHTGQFHDYIDGGIDYCRSEDPAPAEERGAYLKPEHAISIRYNPSDPEKSFYPDAREYNTRRNTTLAVSIALVIFCLLMLYMRYRFKWP
jgi:hypothetical protein